MLRLAKWPLWLRRLGVLVLGPPVSLAAIVIAMVTHGILQAVDIVPYWREMWRR